MPILHYYCGSERDKDRDKHLLGKAARETISAETKQANTSRSTTSLFEHECVSPRACFQCEIMTRVLFIFKAAAQL